jgi:hypothetical protein
MRRVNGPFRRVAHWRSAVGGLTCARERANREVTSASDQARFAPVSGQAVTAGGAREGGGGPCVGPGRGRQRTFVSSGDATAISACGNATRCDGSATQGFTEFAVLAAVGF